MRMRVNTRVKVAFLNSTQITGTVKLDYSVTYPVYERLVTSVILRPSDLLQPIALNV